MKISLETVRQILREVLGFDSFTAGFITSVKEDPEIPTACITKDGNLSYNPEFIKKHVSCKEDLFSVIMHELLHPLFGHFIYDSGEIEGISADSIINAVISTVYGEASRYGNLFQKLYKREGIEGLLRPVSQMSQSRFERVYDRLYGQRNTSTKMSTGELITTLKILLDIDQIGSVLLLGSHGDNKNTEGRLSKEVVTKIAEDIKRSSAASMSRMAGYNVNLFDMFMEALRTHLSIKRVILQRFTTQRKLDKFKERFNTHRNCCSPIPLYPSKRDLVLLANGFYPGFFHNRITMPNEENRGLVIFLDASGSVNEYLPKILGILRNLKNVLTSIFLFSNRTYEIPFKNLLKGEIKTTGGTDFDCIAESIIERKFTKAVVLTDGYASMRKDNSEKLKKLGLTTLTILFDRAQTCRDFEVFGDVVRLEDVCN